MTTTSQKTSNAAPDWIKQTPEAAGPIGYVLIADRNCEWAQSIDLTRAEFIALKKHLAELRGITPRQ